MRACPICHRPVPEAPENPDHPFCSARCKLVDLGNWLGGEYRIPDDAALGGEGSPERPERRR